MMGSNKEITQNDIKMVTDFPYEELLNISAIDLNRLKQILPVLLKISKFDLFYTNLKSVRITLEFILSNLSIYDDVFPKDTFFQLLRILKEIIFRLGSNKKLHHVVPEMDKIFEILCYISDLNIFDHFCARLCADIILELLKPAKQMSRSISKSMKGLLENVSVLKADVEIAKIADITLTKFPLDSDAFNFCSSWLMENGVHILEHTQIKKENDDEKVTVIISTMFHFYNKFGKLVRTNNPHSASLEKPFKKFLSNLMRISHQLIHLCCKNTIKSEARMLLGVVLFEFLNAQFIISQEIEIFMSSEIEQFSVNLRDWPKKFSRTFFWICHLLYAHKSYVWTSVEILDSISRLIYSQQRRRLITVPLLKSVCFIYPFAIQGYSTSTKRLLGDDILNTILCNYSPVLDKVVSFTKSQILWFLLRGSEKLKETAIRIWLMKSSNKDLEVLKEALICSKSEILLISVLLHNLDTKIVTRTVQLIQQIHSSALTEEIQLMIPKYIGNIDLFGILIQTCQKIPQDLNIALKLLKAISVSVTMITDDNVLKHICRYTRNLMTGLQADKNLLQFLCNNMFLIRFLVLRVDVKNGDLTVEILQLLRKFLRYHQENMFSTKDSVELNLAPLMQASSSVVEKTLDLLCQIVSHTSIVTLKEESVLEIQYKLYDLAEVSSTAAKSYNCLNGLLKLYPGLLGLPTTSLFVEERCFYSGRRTYSSGSLKFMLLWINMMFRNSNRSLFVLPKNGVLKSYLMRSKGLRADTVQRYLNFLTVIYSESHVTD